jgi:hypothetical protein
MCEADRGPLRGVNRSPPREGSGGAVDAALRVARFSPKNIPSEVWAEIGPVVREAVTKATPRDSRDATELLTRTAFLAEWCRVHGLGLRPEVMFAPHTINRCVMEGCSHLSEGSRANYRCVMQRVGAAVLGPEVYPPRVTFGQAERLTPYSEHDVRALVGWSRGLPTARMRDATQSLLGLCLGAGLASVEANSAAAGWVERTQGSLILVVGGRRARRVPMIPAWEWAVQGALDRSDGGLLFLPDRRAVRAKQLSRFVEQLPRHGPPKLSVRRLRATWIVGRLDDRVPLNVLAAAAGVGPVDLAAYAASMAPVAEGLAERLLRGDAP